MMKSLGARVWLAVLVLSLGLSTVPALGQENKPSLTPEAVQQLRQDAAHRTRRIIYDNDGNEPVYYCETASAQEMLDKRTTAVVGSQVDTIVYCTWSSGFSLFTHNTKVGEVFTCTEEGFSKNKTQAFIDQGTDPLEIMVKFCREKQIEVFWSMRMNDIHDAWGGWYSPYLFPKLKKDHPEYLLGDEEHKPVNGRWTGVDYGRPEIRELAFQFFEEVCENYDVDGVMLDFFRHPVFFKSHAYGGTATQEDLDAMTDLVRRIRTMADSVAQKKGHPILVAVRVPDSAEYCKAIGLDLEGWLQEHLIDWFAASGYFRLNPWETTVALGHRYHTPVYPCLSETRLRDKEASKLRGSLECYRARAEDVWNAGADGVYLFNFFNPHSPLWNEVGAMATLAPLDKVYTTGARGNGDLSNVWYRGGEQFRRRTLVSPEFPRAIGPGETFEVDLTVGQAPVAALKPRAALVLRMKEQPPDASVTVQFNGHPLEAGSRKDNHLSFAVAPEWIEKGGNRIAVTAGASAPLALVDVYLRMSYEGAGT